MIELKNVSYKNILKNISVEFNDGINFLKGENGAGKSTLLDCVSGINTYYDGEIIGNNSIIYMNQNMYFDNRLKACDFVQFVFELNNMNAKKKQFIEYVECFGDRKQFEDIMEKKVGMLSGGEKVILFFTTLTFIDREWYIFDEPFAGVDNKGKEYMTRVINELLKRDKNIIITSHEQQPLYDFENMNIINIAAGEIV